MVNISILPKFLIVIYLIQIINSTQITNFTEIKLATSATYEITSGCQEVKIPISFKRLVLMLESKNIDRVVITDKKITECDNKHLGRCCAKDSTFCLENINPTANEFRLNYCIDYTYVYACLKEINNSGLRELIVEEEDPTEEDPLTNANPSPVVHPEVTPVVSDDTLSDDTEIKTEEKPTESTNPPETAIPPVQQSGFITVTTSIISEQGCQTTEYFQETECSSLGQASCLDKQRCSTKCSYVECRKDLNDPDSRVFAICLPSKLTDGEMIQRCKNHNKFYEPQVITPQLYRVNCDKKLAESEEVVEKESSHSFFKLLLVIFGVLVLSTFITSVYYRFKVSIDGVPPFEPPAFVPNFIFPRQANYY